MADDDWATWARRELGRLLAPGINLSKVDRDWLIRSQEILRDRPDKQPSSVERDRLRRALRRYGLEPKAPSPSPPKRTLALAEEPENAGWQHRPGAPPPKPPPLRRRSGTWDPCGEPGGRS